MWGRCLNRLLAGLLVASAFPVAASTEAFAGASGLSFELVDLTPDDGIAPGFWWGQRDAFSSVAMRSDQRFESVLQADGSLGWGISYAAWASWDTPSGGAGFTSQLSVPGASALTNETGISTHTATRGGEDSMVSGIMMSELLLSAHAELRLTGAVNLFVNGGDSVSTLRPTSGSLPYGMTFSQSSAYVDVYFGETTFSRGVTGQNYVAGGDSYFFPAGDYALHDDASFSLSWRNDGDESQAGMFAITAQSTVTQLLTSPVPEPGTWAMMALGLIGLTALCQKKRSH